MVHDKYQIMSFYLPLKSNNRYEKKSKFDDFNINDILIFDIKLNFAQKYHILFEILYIITKQIVTYQ